MQSSKQNLWPQRLWDAWCICSVIGIWPRYIEPHCLQVKHVDIPLDQLSSDLNGFKILHFSDLHWHEYFSPTFAQRLIKKINLLQPDLIAFTGDFLCQAQLRDADGLKHLLCHLKAKHCFAVLGNHDYNQFVSVNDRGDYDVDAFIKKSIISKGFKRLFHSVPLTKQVSVQAQHVVPHPELLNLLSATPFQLLHNQSTLIPVGSTYINICGVGEYTTGRLDSSSTFANYHLNYPGIVLCHNPDGASLLTQGPAQLILSGHTHGGQLNVPGLWKKFTYLENPSFKRGLKILGKHQLYINRGIGGVMPFRWFSLPELTLMTLVSTQSL